MNQNKYIVACVNGLAPSDSVIDHAAWLSKRMSHPVKLFHTLDQQYTSEPSDLSGTLGMDTQDELMAQIVEIEHNQNKLLKKKGELILESAKKRLVSKIPTEAKLCLRHGRLIENMLDINENIDCVVIGKYGKSHQSKSNDNVVGHKVESVIRSLQKPVVVVNDDFKNIQKILVALDESENSKKVLSFLKSQINLDGIELNLINVSDDSAASLKLLNSAKVELDSLGLNIQVAPLTGSVDAAILKYRDELGIDMLVMGAFGHNWLHDLIMGSVTSKILSECKQPILFVR